MPRSHWLDPLARRVLQATGQLPGLPRPTQSQPSRMVPREIAFLIDVNRASRDQWLQLPGCSQDTADLLVRLQQGGVQFACADDLFRLLELPSDLVRLWTPHLDFQWHGDAPPQPQATPLDLNNASTDQLALLGWPEQRLANLMRERRRSGFKNLADLQERLCLPASSVEALIGRVSFGSRRAGPSLPLP